MSESIYDSRPQLHPVLEPYQRYSFPFDPHMYPEDFIGQYHSCPVRLPSGWPSTVAITRYQAGATTETIAEKQRLVKKIREHHGDALSPELKDWLKTTRPTAVFAGHGLPEEVSLVCEQAMVCGHVQVALVREWAHRWIGLDCNGFVCFYFVKLGTLSRVVHKHPRYAEITRVARSVAEVDYDSVLLWTKSGDNKHFKVKVNPQEDGAHIAVVDTWHEHGRSLLVAERGGENRFKGHTGIHCGIYDIVAAPKAGCDDNEAIWHVRSREPIRNKQAKVEKVFITRRMQAF
jgi:hypothetical protein